MSTKIYVPRDAAALSVGANAVVDAIQREAKARGEAVEIVRNGSRGMFWLEPLVEVETAQGRVGYGPVKARDVASLFDAGALTGGDHALRVGLIEDLDWMKRQQRLTFARIGVIDPFSLADYCAHGGLEGLKKALTLAPAEVVEQVRLSGLRGRGGAGFPAGIKWKTVHDAQADRKYVVCNADEGDSGTFADRMVFEGDPFMLIEGMAIAAYAVGATKGFIYLRSEYPHAANAMESAIHLARQAGWIGKDAFGREKPFDLELRIGAGAYICGEETSLLESLEGKRGLVRAKPPLPAISGLFGKPTLINNVLTLAAVPYILAEGGKAYGDYGMGRSRGTLPIQLAGNVLRGGLIERAFGVTLREIIEDFGGGTASGRPIRAVQVGGPLGAYLSEKELDLPLDYETLAANRALLGHGGVVVFDDSVDMAKMARFAFHFCAKESCGKCTPCRIGAVRGEEMMTKIIAGRDVEANIALVRDLCEVMTDGSLCAHGGLTPMPVLSAIDRFPEDFVPAERKTAAE
ncbi:formate dehydrogenase [Rhodoblastus acidophilus]|uniref:Formate dehydrogenase n=1 Tax=Candidatus Rhodoblastus alkanivorans TaxID=2954117 RepID=A0ABS9Z6K0_9HYPH|nr:formate dehydrogenase beta subunit [Candidatus Rhodoblastus alkanivorans]MCI4679700.1 formate dehydrogenase [Candidatus Rhodoblastus alkanivorans]MCI4683238.1 formate dehydrogenase [Candidatus Rhodoblastus alkanivorans]MDI4640550.1 formate dehydrogenase [Rhodoblastus acidophilus]